MALTRLSAAMAATVALSSIEVSLACTAIAVGKDASASGSPMVGHSEDSGPSTNDVRLVRVPRKQWPEGSTRPLYAWRSGYPRVVSNDLLTPDYAPAAGEVLDAPLAHIPQVKETWAYWDTDYAVQNEWGLSIGESTCTAKTVGWPSNLPYGHNNAGIEDLSKIALERCKTARCAAETMGTIAVEQGFYSADSGDPSAPAYTGSSECLLLADATPGEVWIFNIMTGKNNASAIWAAERVPDDHVTISANSFTIREMDLSDSKKFLYSPEVYSLAEEMGWGSRQTGPSGEVFDFFAAYGFPGTGYQENILDFYSGRRMWRVFSLLSPEEGAKLDANKGNLPHTVDPYPNSVRAPKNSVTAQMLMDVYRDHYEGTAYDLTVGVAAGPFGNPNRGPAPLGINGLWERAISMYRTTWSFVLEAKPDRRSVTWFGWDAPHGTAYLPLFGAATEDAPESFHSRDGHMSKFSRNVAFWAFNLVSQIQDRNYRLIHADVIQNAHKIEGEAAKAIATWEADVAKTGNHVEPLSLLTQKCNTFVHKTVEDYWQYAFSLVAKYHHYGTTYNESAVGGMELARYPAWWLQSPEVGFTSWQQLGPFHGIVLDEAFLPAHVSLDSAPQQPLQMIPGRDFLWCLLAVFAAAAAHQVGLRRGQARAEKDDDKFYAVLA